MRLPACLWASQLGVMIMCSRAGVDIGRKQLYSCYSQSSEIHKIRGHSTSLVGMPVWWHGPHVPQGGKSGMLLVSCRKGPESLLNNAIPQWTGNKAG